MLLDLVTTARRKKEKEALWELPSSQHLLAEILSSALTFTILYTWSNNSCFSYGFRFSFFFFHCKFLISVLLHLFSLQSSKTTPEGTQALAQKTEQFYISHTESRNSLKLWPGACSLLGDLLRRQQHQSRDNRHGAFLSAPGFPCAHVTLS